MQRKIIGESYRTTVVCVDSYDRGVPTGRFCNPGGCGEYHSLTQLLTRMECMLDDMALPQSFTAARSFARSESPFPIRRPDMQIESGKLATFAVRILFRQNASWQGSVKWLEGGMEQSFRSALELILLMDSVLSDMDNGQVG